MIFIVAIAAVLVFVYFSRFVENKRANSRHQHNARRQELLERTLATAERIKDGTPSVENKQKREDESKNG